MKIAYITIETGWIGGEYCLVLFFANKLIVNI